MSPSRGRFAWVFVVGLSTVGCLPQGEVEGQIGVGGGSVEAGHAGGAGGRVPAAGGAASLGDDVPLGGAGSAATTAGASGLAGSGGVAGAASGVGMGTGGGGASGAAQPGTAGTSGAGGQPREAGKGGAPSSAAQGIYASDGFSSPPGEINSNFFDIGRGSGTGWATAWQQGEHSGPGYYAFADAKPLSFSNLTTSGNYMAHKTWDLGRMIDLKQPAVASLVQNDQIARPGTVVWLSTLVRLDSTSVSSNADVVFVTLHHGGLGYHFYGSDSAWVAGVYPSRGVTKWSLWVGSGTASVAPDRYEPKVQSARMSNKAVTIGTAQLIVVKVEISGGSSDKISLYVDPPSLGGAEPAVPDVTALTGQSAKFKAFAFSGGGDDQTSHASSFDEVRIGPTFAAVTPTR